MRAVSRQGGPGRGNLNHAMAFRRGGRMEVVFDEEAEDLFLTIADSFEGRDQEPVTPAMPLYEHAQAG